AGIPLAARSPLALAGPSRTAVRPCARRPGVRRPLHAGGVGHEPLRRQLQLARPDLVPPQLPRRRGARALSPLLRRFGARRMPGGLRPSRDARRRRPRALPAAREPLRPQRQRAPALSRRRSPLPRRCALARPAALLRVLLRRHRPRSRRELPRLDDARDPLLRGRRPDGRMMSADRRVPTAETATWGRCLTPRRAPANASAPA